VALVWFSAPKRVRMTSEFRRALVNGFYDRMVNARLSEIGQRPDAPFAYAGTVADRSRGRATCTSSTPP
jgi:hypothetical protein